MKTPNADKRSVSLGSRRQFIAAATATTVLASPAIASARRPVVCSPKETIIGEGEFKYRVNHQICQLPDKYQWSNTHNVALDEAGNIYVIHEGKKEQKDHPAIFVFDATGKFMRAFGSQFQGGGHGLDIRKEGKQEFLYVAAYHEQKCFAKMTLVGETVWYKKAPMESGVYAVGEDTSTQRAWHRKGFLPTNFAFLDDGGFLLADGYGSYYIHQFDKDAKWVRCFGGPGDGEGKFSLSHGVCVDKREGREPSLLVADRNPSTVQRLTMDGEHIETLTGFRLPCNVDTWKNAAVIPEYGQRVTILDENNQVICQLGDGAERFKAIKGLPGQPQKWQDGEFMQPHDACFDLDGNIIVAERVPAGRVTKLTRVV